MWTSYGHSYSHTPRIDRACSPRVIYHSFVTSQSRKPEGPNPPVLVLHGIKYNYKLEIYAKSEFYVQLFIIFCVYFFFIALNLLLNCL